MKTDVTTPQGIFVMPQHLTVPIYQRPYVWTEDEETIIQVAATGPFDIIYVNPEEDPRKK